MPALSSDPRLSFVETVPVDGSRAGSRRGGYLPAVPYPVVFPSEPGFNYERSKWEKGCTEDYGASPVCPSGWFAGETEQDAEEDEESAMNSAWKVDGLLVAMDPLEHNRAIEKDKVRGPFQQPCEPQSANRSFQHGFPNRLFDHRVTGFFPG